MRVVLAEDSLLLREGLVRLLDEAGATVVAAVGDGESLVTAVQEHKPDVAVVDVRMPPTFTDEGLRAALEVRRTVPGTAILVLSQYVEESYASDLLTAGGGGGYLLKDRGSKLADLSDPEREVMALMAGGRTNPAIGRTLVISQGAVEKHISSIFTKLGLPPSGDDHRRVMAVLTWLGV